mgnify:CR=1 FL=1
MLIFYLLKNLEIPTFETFISVPEIYIFIVGILLLYIMYSSVYPDERAVKFVSNPLGRLLILMLIVFISNIKLELGLLLTIGYLVTIYNDRMLGNKQKFIINK